MKKVLSLIIVVIICMMGCVPRATRSGDDVVREAPSVVDKPERKTKTRSDTRPPETVVAPPPVVEEEEQLAFARPEDAVFEYERIPGEEILTVPDSLAADSLYREDWFAEEPDITIVEDTPDRPRHGGKARIYLQREFVDDAVSDMVRLNPFGDDGTDRRVFLVTDSTHRRLELTLTREIRRANGRRATALDFIELWSRFMKARPAQGLALFRNVDGAEGYVTERDPLVRGFTAADEHTIKIRFARPDPLAFRRLTSPKLIGGPFLLGAYYTSSVTGAEQRLLPNANSLSQDVAFLEECVVVTGGDPDPLASFARGDYVAMTLYTARDLNLARGGTADFADASLYKLPSDRYFLSCKSADENVRRFVRRTVNGKELLSNVIVAEGEEIGSVVAKASPVNFPRGHVTAPTLSKPFRLIYRVDDPISKTIAEKISADLNVAGMNTEAIGHAADRYEAALVRGQYDCAVGWVSEAVTENQTEQLHLATVWFADEINHEARVRDYREIPLFSVDNYLILRGDMRLYQNRVSGLWKNVPDVTVDVEE